MHVFITGGSGMTGPAVITELLAAGHTVTGLARSDAAAARLEGLGAAALRGSLQDLEEASAHFDGASAHFGSTLLATMLAVDAPVSSDFTRALLGWEPTHCTLLEDLRYGDYITPAPAEP